MNFIMKKNINITSSHHHITTCPGISEKETMPKTSPEGKLPIGQGDIHEQDKEK
jgi:hypothetical protein